MSPLRVICALFALTLAACSADPSRVRVEQGTAQGVVRDGVRIFRSLPYAAAPIGDLRFRGPQPAPAWDGVRDATQPGPLCTQNTAGAAWGPWTGALAPQGAVSEDCLTLSVWAPENARGDAPVMFWMPGGGFTDGGEGMAVYDGTALAQRGIVVVTISYRVDSFGLLAHPALEREADGAYGNQLLRDTLAALQWVHQNIGAFGGDPGRVTIAGQSAGAALAYVLMDSPQASGLFRGAILQSFAPGSDTLPDEAAVNAVAEAFAASVSASDLAALRATPAETLLAAHPDGLNLYPDGVLITDPRFAAPPYLNDVPVLAGMTADELSFFEPDLAFHRRGAERYGPEFAQRYPATTDAEALDAVLRAEREQAMTGLTRWARATQGGAPLYLYLWTHAMPGPDAAKYRAFHSSEVMYMFGSLGIAPERGFTDEDRAISERMLDTWATFVRTGDPNGGVSGWPRADVDAPVFMELGDGFEPLAPLPADVSAYWNAYFDRVGSYRFD